MNDTGHFVPAWPAPPNVRVAVTTRQLAGRSQPPFDRCNLGARSGDDPVSVSANRHGLVAALGLPAQPRWLRQVHGVRVIDVPDALAVGIEQEPEADASTTRTCDVVLAVLTADCLPIVLCSDDGAAVAVVHAGWRGLAAGVIDAALSRLSASPSRVLAWLGPGIGAASYEVGEDVRAAFVDRSADAAITFAPTRAHHWHCDLYALARLRLGSLGVERVFGGGFDTFTDARFYSYRREPVTGRFATLAWLSSAG